MDRFTIAIGLGMALIALIGGIIWHYRYHSHQQVYQRRIRHEAQSYARAMADKHGEQVEDDRADL